MRKKFYSAIELVLKHARAELCYLDISMVADSVRLLLDNLEKHK